MTVKSLYQEKKKLISYVLFFVFLGIFVWYFLNNIQDFKVLLEVKPHFLALVAVGHLAIIFTNGLIIKWIMEPYQKYATTQESFYVSFISTIGNFFLPVGSGTGMRAVYLKKKFGLGYNDFFSTLYGNYVIVFFLNSLIGIAALLALGMSAPTGAFYVLIGAFTALFCTTLYMTFFGLPSIVNKILRAIGLRIAGVIAKVFDGWNFIVRHRKLLMRLLFAAFLNILVALLTSYSAIHSLGFEISIWALLLYSSLSTIVLLINITPAAIGIRESLYIYASALLGFTVPQILVIAIVERGVKFFVLSVGWVFTHGSNLIKSSSGSP